jgi:hypothetical protein
VAGSSGSSYLAGRCGSDILQYARKSLKDVEQAYDQWVRSQNDFGLSNIVLQGFGSKDTYEAARDNLTFAHEMIMLALAIQQR